MKILGVVLGFALASCSSNRVKNQGEVTKMEMTTTDVLVMPRADIGKMQSALQSGAKTYTYKSANGMTVDLDPRGMRTIAVLHERATRLGAEQKGVEGPLSLRCTAEICHGDFKMSDSNPHKIEGGGVVKVRAEPKP